MNVRPTFLYVLVATTSLTPLGYALPALAQGQQAGVSAGVRGEVQLASAGSAAGVVGRQVKSGEAIYLGDRIRSGASAGMQIMLLDETVFTIGPDSEMAIDEFVYNPGSGGKVAARVTKGVFRFVSGQVAKANPSDMEVRLPAATIGVRGTTVVGSVQPDGTGFAALLGPGPGNNANERPGSIVVGPVQVQRSGFGAQMGPGLTPTLFQVPPQLLQQTLGAIGRPPPPQQAAGGGGGGGGGGNASEQAGQSTAGGLSLSSQQSVTQMVQQQNNTLANEATQTSSLGAIGNSTFEDLRSIPTGQFHYFGSGSISDGSYEFGININFAARTVGGGSSFIFVDQNCCSGSFNISGGLTAPTQSFASGNGPFKYVVVLPQNFEGPGISGSNCNTSACSGTFTLAPQNSATGIATSAQTSLAVTNDSGTVFTGSATGTRANGLVIPPS